MSVKGGSGDAGGAAATGGVEFQHRLGAYFAVLMLRSIDLGPLLDIPRRVLLERVAFEARSAVDDLVLWEASPTIYVQVKRSVSLSADTTSPFASAIHQFVAQWRENPEAYFLLATGPNASRRITQDLKKILAGRRTGGGDDIPLTKSEDETLETFRSTVNAAMTQVEARAMTKAELEEFSAKLRVAEFHLESLGSDERSALAYCSALPGLKAEPDLLWSYLIGTALAAGTARHSLNRAYLTELIANKWVAPGAQTSAHAAPRSFLDRHDIPNAVVRVLGPAGVVGTGFFVSREVVVTCARVVRRAGASASAPAVRLDRGDGSVPLEADVDAAYWRDEDGGDIAVLTLRTALPTAPAIFPVSSWESTKPSTAYTFGFPDGTGRGIEGTTVRDTTLDQAGTVLLRVSTAAANSGFEGAPLLDEERGCIVAMLRDGKDGAMLGTPMETIAERLVGERAGSSTGAIVRWIEQVSATLPPRIAWPARQAVAQAPLDPNWSAELAARLAECPALSEARRRSLLVRLPSAALHEIDTTSDVGSLARTVIEAMSREVAGLALLAATVYEVDGERASTKSFDELVSRALLRTASEGQLRRYAKRLADAGLTPEELGIRLAAVAPHGRLEGIDLAVGHESMWTVRFLANLRPSRAGKAPLDVFLDRLEAEVEPIAHAPPGGPESVVVVAVEERELGYAVKVWGTARMTKLHDDENRVVSLDEVRRCVATCWSRLHALEAVVPHRTVIEFILPRSLICEDVENWKVSFGRRQHPLAGLCRVVVRSWERLYDPSLRSTWGAWSDKWQGRGGTFHWITTFAPEDADRVFDQLGQPGISGVAFAFAPAHVSSDPDDVVAMCVDAGIPIAIWLRESECLPADPKDLVGPHEHGERFCDLPEWVRRARAAVTGSIAKAPPSVGHCVTLLWDPSDRLPPDLTIARQNIDRKSDE